MQSPYAFGIADSKSQDFALRSPIATSTCRLLCTKATSVASGLTPRGDEKRQAVLTKGQGAYSPFYMPARTNRGGLPSKSNEESISTLFFSREPVNSAGSFFLAFQGGCTPSVQTAATRCRLLYP